MVITKHTQNKLHWYHSTHLSIPHAMFTSSGGTSDGPYNSLNLSYGVKDNPDNVAANRDAIKNVLDLHRLVSLGQVHGDNILKITDGTKDLEFDGYDGLVTNIPGTGLLIQQADCQAVLLYDPTLGVIGAAHCGWRGTTNNILAKIIEFMQAEYSTSPKNLHALISPSLGPCCAQFINHRKELPTIASQFKGKNNHFDFWEISKHQLLNAGLHNRNIATTKICTSCNHNFFSYRRAVRLGSPTTGRNGTVIALPSQATKTI
ncbi:MAG: peptidoglycan editing factor PgeF [Desulfobulbaceae bacterium]|nr:peptidoglycan editing factor PgeF [Desulfobulbaceae bacterium]